MRKHRQKTHRSAATRGRTAAVWERLTPPVSLTCSPAPEERGDEARQGREEGTRELSGGTQPPPGRGPPGTAAGSTPEQLPVPQRGPARSPSRGGAPGPSRPRGGGEPDTCHSPRSPRCCRESPPGSLSPPYLCGNRCPPQPSHHTHERARRAAEAQLAAEGDGCRGRAEPWRGGGWNSPSALACCGSRGRAVAHALASSRDRLSGAAFFLPFFAFFFFETNFIGSAAAAHGDGRRRRSSRESAEPAPAVL